MGTYSPCNLPERSVPRNAVVSFVVWMVCWMTTGTATAQPIDRHAVVTRHNPHLNELDTLAALTVGNGRFAMTVDATGLQTFPLGYRNGIPLGTMSEWGWHAFANPEGFTAAEALEEKDFGRGHTEPYAAQFRQPGRQHDASEWLRQNPHRLHLGTVGFDIAETDRQQVTAIDQELNLWEGCIDSRFGYRGGNYWVKTVCHPDRDEVAASIDGTRPLAVTLRFAYPTGGHSDDGCDWQATTRHTTELVTADNHHAVLRRTIDDTTYDVVLRWQGKARLSRRDAHTWVLLPRTGTFAFSCLFSQDGSHDTAEAWSFDQIQQATARHWQHYWTTGGMVDFSHVADARAQELERRTILSLYLMYAQEAGSMPPQETGLTYNSWFGKFHLEMEWWHQAHYALWSRPQILDRTMDWYFSVRDKARTIASRQGFRGVRWMKMTEPTGEEAPSNVGSYLIWQQPHVIYLAELLRRSGLENAQEKYCKIVDETADFMRSFAVFDTIRNQYILKGCIPAQETLKAAETVNPPFELNYWHWALLTAQQWRDNSHANSRDDHGLATYRQVAEGLSPLACNDDSLYLAAESATDTYRDRRFTSDHPALLGALGILPESPLTNRNIMAKTLDWIWDNWNWDKTWGWDYPMVAMTAARLQQRGRAVDALLMPRRTNTYLPNGHNYQDSRLRVYMPGNGGLLTAIAMMCAGWDGHTTSAAEGARGQTAAFPEDWDVRWEGLLPMP